MEGKEGLLGDYIGNIRAGIVDNFEKLKDYPWSGHSALIGRVERKWQDTIMFWATSASKTGIELTYLPGSSVPLLMISTYPA